MRMVCLISVVSLHLMLPAVLAEETAAEAEAQGIAALKHSQSEPDAIIAAAIYFGKSAAAYDQAKDEAKATEMNSFLYWCKKKMTLKQMDAFLNGGDASAIAIAKHMQEMEAVVVPAADAQNYFERADAYAQAHPDEHLLIAVRFFEVADRFIGTELSVKAQRRSLDEMQSVTQSAALAPRAPPAEKPNEDPAPRSGVPARAAVPPAARLRSAEQLIREINKDDFAKQSADGGKVLAQKLLQQASDAKDDLAAQYVLLRESGAAAAQSGDFDTALNAIDALAKTFDVDGHAMKADALSKAGTAVKTPEDAKAFAIAALAAIDDAIAADNYSSAIKMLSVAEAAARQSQKAPLAARVQARSKDARALQNAFVTVKAAQQTLKSKPDDPDANLLVGRFLSFDKGEWKPGLPFLAKGSDAKLKELASRELAGDTNADALALGTAWHDLAEKEKQPAVKNTMLERERFWYTSALPKLEGLNKVKIQKRLEELATLIRKTDPRLAGCQGKLYVSCGDKVDVLFNNKVIGQSSQWGDLVPIPIVLANGDTLYFCAKGESKHTYGVSWAFISNDTKLYMVSDEKNTPGTNGALAKDSKFTEQTIGEFWVRTSLTNRMDKALVSRIQEPQAVCVGKAQKSATYRWIFDANALKPVPDSQ